MTNTVKKTDYQKVEGKLYGYKYLVIELKKKQNQLEGLKAGIDISLESIGYDDIKVSPTNRTSDSTADAAITRADKIKYVENEIKKLEYRINCIDIGLEALTKDQRKILQLFYIDDLKWFDIAPELTMTERQCQNHRKEGIELLIGYIL